MMFLALRIVPLLTYFYLNFQALEKSTSGEAAMVGRVIWFTCEGENPADIENLGEISYYPYQGVADYFYPYKNQRGYLSPAVFLHLKNPKRKFRPGGPGGGCKRQR